MAKWKVRTHLFLFAGSLLLGLLCVGGLGLYGIQSTVRDLETVYLNRVVSVELAAISLNIAEGRLASTALYPNKQSTGVLHSVQDMPQNLCKIIGKISLASEQIECATLQLATSSEQGLSSAARQSDTASSMAATVEQLSVSINHIADNARQPTVPRRRPERLPITDDGIAVMQEQRVANDQVA